MACLYGLFGFKLTFLLVSNLKIVVLRSKMDKSPFFLGMELTSRSICISRLKSVPYKIYCLCTNGCHSRKQKAALLFVNMNTFREWYVRMAYFVAYRNHA